MARPRSRRWMTASISLAVLGLHSCAVMALSQQYCSTQNTGSDGSTDISLYQSNGRCHDLCLASYAFAIVQGENCWCSNYAPASQSSVSKCSIPCPGFPDESCGGTGLFGYIALNNKPSGTAGSSSSSTIKPSTTSAGRISSYSSPSPSPSAKKTSVDTPAVVVEETVTEDTSLYMPTSTPAPTVAVTTSSSSPKTSSWTPTPVTSLQVVTLSGNIVTQTVTSTPSTPAGAYLGKEKATRITPGYIVAAVIASIAGIILLCLAFFWFWRRRKIALDDEKYAANMRNPPELDRHTSVHSKAGLLDSVFPPTLATRFSSHNGDYSSSDAISPISAGSERRNSRPMLVDQRLNPNLLMVHDNGSRSSIKTLEDHRDYGRMLKVRNPDPDPERKSFS